MAVNKGLELLRDPKRGGVAVIGVVFSSLGTDLRISESWLNSNYRFEKLTQIVSQVVNCGHTGRLGQFVEQVLNHFSIPGLHIKYFYFYFYSIRMQ